MRALLVTSSFPQNAQDTAGAFLVPLVRAMRETGMQLDVLAPRGPTTEAWMEGLLHAAYAPRSLERLFYGAGAPEALRRMGVAALPLAASGVAALTARIRRLRPDVVYAHWLVPAGLSALLSGVPYVAYAHGSDVTLLERRAPWLARAVAAHARLVCVPSSSMAKRVQRLCGVNARVAPLPVERQPTDPPLGHWDVGFLGRLVRSKGVDVLLRACAAQGFSVVVAGDGPERQALEALAGQLGVRAEFLGWVEPGARGRLWGAVGVAAVPSVAAEGSPSVVWEACAHGVPVVVSRVPGLEEDVEDAFCVPPGDAKALGNMLRVALLDENWRDRAAAAASAQAASRGMAVLGGLHAGLLAQACARRP